MEIFAVEIHVVESLENKTISQSQAKSLYIYFYYYTKIGRFKKQYCLLINQDIL